jgi:hypothetical protein
MASAGRTFGGGEVAPLVSVAPQGGGAAALSAAGALPGALAVGGGSGRGGGDGGGGGLVAVVALETSSGAAASQERPSTNLIGRSTAGCAAQRASNNARNAHRCKKAAAARVNLG